MRHHTARERLGHNSRAEAVLDLGRGRQGSRGRSILFVIGTLDVGGTELHLMRIARGLVKRGWEVSVYSLAGEGPLQAELLAGGVSVSGSPKWLRKYRSGAWRALRLTVMFSYFLLFLQRNRFAIAHFFLPGAYLIGAPAALIAGVPIRIMSRRSQNLYQSKRPLVGLMEALLHRSMTAILGNSRRVWNELRHAERVPAWKLGLIYNGLDISAFTASSSREEVRARLGCDASDFLIIVVANLIPYKGHDDLLDALALARPALPPEWRLLVVGRDDGIGEHLRARAETLGLTNHVDFLGLRKDVPDLLAASDLGVLCSHEEGFSNAVIEGMAAGLPMVVTDVGGNSEAVRDGVCGSVVPARDIRRIAEAIVALACDAERRTEYALAARRRVMESFTLDRCLEEYDLLYRSLLKRQEIPTVLKVVG